MEKQFDCQEITCKNAMNHLHSTRLPYEWDLNVYRGCGHHCEYCFAMYTHTYMEDGDFFHHIYVKKNIVEELEKKLSSKHWKREIINLGGVTDNYQPLEATYQIMPEILKLLIHYRNPAIISTKSTLILRDIDLLRELSQVAPLSIAFTITTLNDQIASKIEPGADPPIERLAALARLKKETNAAIGIHLMPMIPYLTATRANLDQLLCCAHKIGVDYCIPGLLSLRGITRKSFLSFFKKTYPSLFSKFHDLDQDKEKKKLYKQQFYKLLYEYQQKHQISFDYRKPIIDRQEQLSSTKYQLNLFDWDKKEENK